MESETVFNSFRDELLERIRESGALNGYRIVKSFDESETVYPLSPAVLCFGSEQAQESGYLIGSSQRLCRECLVVSVLADESLGGEYAEDCAKEALSVILDLDVGRRICSVSVEKSMYDKLHFAYKVVMRFTLAEQGVTE